MSDPNEVFVEAAEAGSIGIAGIRPWKVVTVSGTVMCLSYGLCNGALSCCCGNLEWLYFLLDWPLHLLFAGQLHL